MLNHRTPARLDPVGVAELLSAMGSAAAASLLRMMVSLPRRGCLRPVSHTGRDRIVAMLLPERE